MTSCIVRAPKPSTHKSAPGSQSNELEQIRNETAGTLADTLGYALQSDADPVHVVREIREALAPYEGAWSTVDQLRFIYKDGSNSSVPDAHAAVAGFFDLRALALSAIALLDTDAAQEEVVRVLNQLAGRATDLANRTDAVIMEAS